MTVRDALVLLLLVVAVVLAVLTLIDLWRRR